MLGSVDEPVDAVLVMVPMEAVIEVAGGGQRILLGKVTWLTVTE